MMARILLRSAWETLRADGIKVFLEQSLRYVTLYGSPVRIGRYWLNRLMGRRRQVVSVQGSLMELDLTDRGIHADLFISRVREPQATEHLQRLIEPDWVVVDIGANIGYYVLMESRRAKQVIAIEPGEANYYHLLRNIKLNGYQNIETHRLAIGDHEGEVGFEIAKACNWNKIARDGKGDVKVNMLTLDKFLYGRKVDFLRMDVEGYELQVLKGMAYTLKHSRPDMFIEVHRDLLRDYGSSQLEFMEMLAGYGYSLSKSFISARPGPQGKLTDLLADAKARRLITERGIASHMFFKWEE